MLALSFLSYKIYSCLTNASHAGTNEAHLFLYGMTPRGRSPHWRRPATHHLSGNLSASLEQRPSKQKKNLQVVSVVCEFLTTLLYLGLEGIWREKNSLKGETGCDVPMMGSWENYKTQPNSSHTVGRGSRGKRREGNEKRKRRKDKQSKDERSRKLIWRKEKESKYVTRS